MTNRFNDPGATAVDSVLLVVSMSSVRVASIEAVAERLPVGVLHTDGYDASRGDVQGRQVIAYVAEFSEPLDKLQNIVGAAAPAPPVVAMTGGVEGIELEVLRRGAWDVLDASAQEATIQRCLSSAVSEGLRRVADRRLIADFYHRSGMLTQAERDVLEAVCEGKLNKQIARDLNVSVRTIEQRRRRLFNKMDVTSAVPLASKVAVVRTLERLANPRLGSEVFAV